ncbi:unnamed protein product [Tetraodon nigroviridis]|uniref:(spotted green pufferfish) hypothetical protein n=1 Tax=Tetraodon nigroviridis TaxID=99883 RepID=Q4SSQ0_TETNG|nr:unnamed protein product [Tetraodon nigroviridis]
MLAPGASRALKMKEDSSGQKDKERKSRLSLFLTKSGSHENVSPHKKKNAPANNVSPESALQWSDSFEELLSHSDGVEVFSQFLRKEFSEENIEFWLACEEYKTIDSETKLLSKAKYIYTVFCEPDSPKEINIDYNTRMAIQRGVAKPTKGCFEAAQLQVYNLMKKDSYPRFLLSDTYLRLLAAAGNINVKQFVFFIYDWGSVLS